MATAPEPNSGRLTGFEALGAKSLAIPTDVADTGQVEAASSEIEKVFGPIDIWINCAMASVFAEFADVTPEEYERMTRAPQACLRG